MRSIKQYVSVMGVVLMMSACAPTQQTPVTTEAPVVDETPIAEVEKKVIKLGVLLPLSGTSAELGAAMLDAILLALDDVQKNNADAAVQVVVIPKDTQGSVQGAMSAADDAISNGANVILGPLFSQSVSAIAPRLQQAGVRALSFSNNQLAAAPGMYVLGFQPQEQMFRVLDYARRRGVNSVAALLPNDAYGRSIKTALDRSGVAIWRTSFYPSNAPTVDIELKQLFPNAGWGEQNERMINGANVQPRYPAQALVMPEGGPALQRLARAFDDAKVEAEELVILGSGQWEDDTVGVPSVLYGSWFAGVDPARRARFKGHFKASYGYEPPRLTSLAYDASAMLVTMAFQHEDAKRAFSRSSIEKAGGFIGPADGLFRLLPNGLSERGLAVLQMTPEGPQVLEAAPERF